jgi:hypothetical protein
VALQFTKNFFILNRKYRTIALENKRMYERKKNDLNVYIHEDNSGDTSNSESTESSLVRDRGESSNITLGNNRGRNNTVV